MNYTDKEIELIKTKAYDKGRLEGCIITLIICVIFLVVSLVK
jgi:hypothetical protein